MSNNKTTTTEGHLVRAIGLPTAIILFVSSIIGSGVYKKIAPMALGLESPGLVLLAWGLAGLVTLLGVLTTTEVGAMITESGGPYAYFKRIYGRDFAFYYGWSSLAVIQSASIASISYVFSQSVNALVELPRLGGAWETWTVLGLFTPLANLGVKIVAVALIAVLATINFRGVRQGSWVSTVITVLVVGSIAAIILLGLSLSDGSMANVQHPSSAYPPYESGLGLAGIMFAAMLSAFWAYEGWLNIGFIGDEVKNPQRNIPMSLIIGIAIVISIYLAINFTYLYVVPMDEMIAIARDENSIAAVAVVGKFLGAPGILFISILICITTLGCTNTTVLTAARIHYALARDRLFFPKIGHINPRFNTPGNALLIQGVWSALLVFSGSFDQLTDMLIFASFIFYGAIAFGVFVLRRKEPDTPRPYRAVGHPVLPALFVVFCACLVVVTCFQRPREAGLGLALILLGTPFLLYWRKKTT
jgi:APA family basic amino acid/polyamine antiporter